MRLYFIILCVVSRVSLEMQAVHHFYMARKERSNSPIHSRYVYNKINNKPEGIKVVNIFDNKRDRKNSTGEKKKRQLDEKKNFITTKKTPIFSDELNISENASKKTLTTGKFKNIDVADVKRHPPKRDVLFQEFERDTTLPPTYELNQFLNDDDDVRTDSRSSNDGWPLFYNSPYEYEPMKFDNEMQKAQDKRFIVPEDRRVIPVHEHIKDDIIDSQIYSSPDFMYSKQTFTTDNPMLGDQPFFSYVLNDYFDKTDYEDPFTFKGLSWGKEFDQEMSFHDIDDYAKRIRRLEDDLPSHKKVYGAETELDKGSLTRGDNYGRNQELKENTNINENENKRNSQSYGNYNGENKRRFRDFADYFANRFGSEDHSKNSKHNVKNNVDQGEKKKGFRKVYHKDEYQEQTEFHDNNNKKVESENKGESKIRVGGSEGSINSKAAAAIGSDKTRIGKSEDNESKKNEKTKKSEHQKRDFNNFSQYRDVAKNAALSNNADYIDRFMA